MQILITHGDLLRTRVVVLNRWQLAAWAIVAALLLLALSALAYQLARAQGVRQGWALGSAAAGPAADASGQAEPVQRDRFLRENLDAMATRLGEMQAKLVKIEAMGERVSNLAGMKADDVKAILKPASAGGRGGPYLPLASPSQQQLLGAVQSMDERADQYFDLFTLAESRLFEERLAKLMIPNSPPIEVQVGSGFGVRTDPFSGRAALHTGLDFAAETGTPIRAAAGGVVLATDIHAAYGQLLEIDHGNGLVTRYAHASRFAVKAGDLVKRGQIVAFVGNSGRSTGPHLHFEVLVEGVPQDPARFLAGGSGAETKPARTRSRR